MVQLLLLLSALILPLSADAAYRIQLKNGSVISGVSSYEKAGGEVTVYFGGGSIGIPEKEILRIEDTDAPERDFSASPAPEQPETPSPATPPAASSEGGRPDRSARVNALRSELGSLNSEIRSVEADEARVIDQINQKKGERISYNTMQLRQLDTELRPLQQELMALNQKKGSLLQRKADVEGELRTLE